MPRNYSAQFENENLNSGDGDQEVFRLYGQGGTTRCQVEIAGLFLSVIDLNAEANEEWLRIRISRGFTTGAGAGAATAQSPVVIDEFDALIGSLRYDYLDGAGSGTSAVHLWSRAFNVRQGMRIWFPRGGGPRMSAGSDNHYLTVRLMAASAATNIHMTATLYLSEYTKGDE